MIWKGSGLLCIAMIGVWSGPPTMAQVSGEREDARALVKRVIDAAPDVPFVSHMRLTTPGDLVRHFTSSSKPLEEELDGRYIEVTDPFNLKDTRYLFYERTEGEDEQFMYLPAMKRVIRLSEKTRREPFLGSTFYITDMVAPALDDFTYSFVGEETIDGRRCRLVESLPKNPKKELYGKTISAIDPADLIVLRSQLYDRERKLFKVLTVDKIEKIDDYWTPLLQHMKNVQDQTASRLETIDVEYNVPLSDEIFHLAHLGR